MTFKLGELRMKKFIISAVLMLFATSSQALVVDPATGGSGDFFWSGGLGASVTFGGDDTLDITLAEDSIISLFAVDDCCVVGDAFGLVIDGSAATWSTSGFTGTGGLYAATAADIFLAAGSHTFDLTVTADCCGAGQGYWSMSAATAVPEPTTLALLSLGLLGFGFTRRKSA